MSIAPRTENPVPERERRTVVRVCLVEMRRVVPAVDTRGSEEPVEHAGAEIGVRVRQHRARPPGTPRRWRAVRARARVERALVLAQGRIEGAGGAAKLLAVNPHTLRGKMRKLRIDWSRFR